MLKEKLQSIFSDDYPGYAKFADEVVLPIFGADFEQYSMPVPMEIGQSAINANIQSINRIGIINDNGNCGRNPIEIFDVTINDNAEITRSRVNIQAWIRSELGLYTHAFIVFHYANPANRSWRLSYLYKPDTISGATEAKRYTYLLGKSFSARTVTDNFVTLASSPLNDNALLDAFSVQALSDEFFEKYRELYVDFCQYITGKRYVKEGGRWVEREFSDANYQYATTFDSDDKLVRDYIKKMFGRIVFLYFLQRKGWLDGNRQYMHDLFACSSQKDNFLDGVLEPLFFEVLNTDKPYRTEAARALPGSENIPYLNGGLFAQDDIDALECVFPEKHFKRLFDFLDSYNFTIDENDTDDAEVGIDPEMLGRIFENLLEDNKDKGAFYTPKEIVDYMCRESIIAYLQDDRFSEEGNSQIRRFVETMNRKGLSDKQRTFLRDKLKAVKICDPAIGSGAFPIGLVNLLSKLYIALGVSTNQMAQIKRHIIEQNIYGVDIEKGAVDIARLRFWLAMIVEEEKPMPLPNLHFKIMQGNSLVESYEGRDLSKLSNTSSTTPGVLDFDSLEKQMLQSSLKTYYSTSDHHQRDRILNDVRNNILRQVYNNFSITFPEDFDPSANDKFFLWHTWFSDVFENGGFDIVIGNPPYIKEYTNRVAFKGFRESSPYYRGKMDIWYGFACQAVDHLKSNGVLCFIATNNWVTNTGASILRNKILDDGRMLQLIDFNDYMIFEDSASIQTMILLLTRQNIDNYTFDYRKLTKDGPKKEDAIKLLSTKESKDDFATVLNPTIKHSILYNNTFNFAPSDKDEILDKMVRDAMFLSSNEVAQGIVFPQDFLNKKSAETIGVFPKGTGVFGLTHTELEGLNLTEFERHLIRPYYTSEQISRYYTSPKNSLWLIYTDSSYNRPDSLDSYPHIKSHLDKFQQIITSSNKPYGLHRAREVSFFQGEKIISQRKCPEHVCFSYSNFDVYVTQTYFVIKSPRYDLKFLTGLFNSKLIEFWLRNRGKMQGNNFQVDKEPLLKIPIKSNTESVEVIGALVNEILTRKDSNQSADISVQETKIDKLVYHLYDLTYDEVLIVDPNTPISREEYENNAN